MVMDCLNKKFQEFISKKPEAIKAAAESGRLSQAKVKEAQGIVDAFKSGSAEVEALMADYGRIKGNDNLAASREAAEYALETLERRMSFRVNQAIKVREGAAKYTNSFESMLKGHNISLVEGVDAIHHGDVGLATKGYLPDSTSFNSRMDSYKSLYGGQIAEVMQELAPRLSFKNYDDVTGREFMRAYEYVTKGTQSASGDISPRMIELAEKAEAWSMNQARDLERAGVDLKGKTSYLMGAFSDVEKLRSTPQKTYVDFMMSHESSIDWENIKALAPGAADSPEQRRAFLEHFYQSKVSNGAIKIGQFEPFRKAGVATVVNSRGEHRLLQFKTADAATAYNQEYGHGGVFETMMYLNDRHARHLALTESYSPTPGALISEVKAQLIKKHGLDALPAIDRMLDNVREASKVDFRDVVGSKTKAAFGLTTDLFRSSVLGSATIPSYVADASNVAIGKAMRGMPWLADFGKSLAKVFDPRLRSDMEELAHMGYSMAVYNDAMMNSDRAPHLHWAEKYAKKGLNAVMKISLLERQTLAQKAVNIASAGRHLAEFIDGKAVDPRLQNYLQSAGITDEVKALLSDAIEDRAFAGRTFRMVNLAKLFESGDRVKMEAATRLSSIVEDIAEIAAPVKSSKAGQFWQRTAQSSSLGYVFTKLAQPLTSYMTAHWQNVLQPILHQEGANRIQLLAAYTIAGAVTGSMLVQIQRLLTGKEPLPVGPELAVRAGAQFALGPIVGMLANAGTSGPVLEDLMALFRSAKTAATLPVNIAKSAVSGKENKQLGKDSVAALKLLTPGQNLWYSKLLMERYVWDQLEESVDGANFRKRVAKRVAREKKNGSGYYWKPGTL